MHLIYFFIKIYDPKISILMITLIKIFITFLAMAKKSMLLVDNKKYYQKKLQLQLQINIVGRSN